MLLVKIKQSKTNKTKLEGGKKASQGKLELKKHRNKQKFTKF